MPDSPQASRAGRGCLATRRAVVKVNEAETYKLIDVDGEVDELFNLTADPLELDDVLPAAAETAVQLDRELKRIGAAVEAQRAGFDAGATVEIDDALVQRLRGLGYLD